MSIADYPPHRSASRSTRGTAGRPGLPPGRGRDVVAVESVGVAAIERTSPASSSSSSTASTSSARPVDAARDLARRGPLVRVRSTDVERSCPRSPTRRSSSRPARTRHGSRSTSTTWRRRRPAPRGGHPPPRAARLTAVARTPPPRRASRTATTPTRSRTSTARAREGGPWPCVVLLPRGLLADRVGPHADDAARGRPRHAGDRRVERRVPAAGQEGGGWPGRSRTSLRPSIGWRTSTRSSRRAS